MKPTTKRIPKDWINWSEIMRRRLEAAGPKIRDLARLSYGAEDIGPKIGIGPQTVRRYARILGIPIQTNGRTVFRLDKREWPEKVPKLLAQGLNQEEVGRRLGCSGSAVCKWLLNQGYKKTSRDIR